MDWILVGLGGAIGAMLRFGVVGTAARLLGPGFPWGTLAVNVAGSLAMGAIAALMLRAPLDLAWLRPLLMTGVLGGFTTFSAFSLDAVTLVEEERIAAAAGYVGASVLLSIGALALGLTLTRSLLS